MKKIKNLYDYAKDNNKKLLFEKVTGITYPTIEGNTSNFLTDYAAMAPELDRMFYIRYSSMKPIIPEENDETTAQYFDEWADSIRSVLAYYLDAWARLYYALSLQYNPIYNVDGETTRRTNGKTEGLSGTDTLTMSKGAQSISNQYGQKQTITDYGQDQNTMVRGAKSDHGTHSEVPFDSGIEKEISADSHSEETYTDTDTRAARTDTSTDTTHTDTETRQTYTDTDTTQYGRQNNVDYTETEVRKGNIGVTMTQQMLNEEFKIRKMAFWDNVFKAICKELLYW